MKDIFNRYPYKRSFPFLKGPFRRPFTFCYSAIRNCRHYWRGIDRSERGMPDNRFVLLCNGRSGSTLIGTQLSSFANVHWADERVRFNHAWPEVMMRSLARSADNCSAFGLKMFVNLFSKDGLTHRIEYFLQRLYKRNWRLIFLTRDNLLMQAVSFEKAFYFSQPTFVLKDSKSNRPKARKIHLDPQRIMHVLDWLAAHRELLDNLIQPFPHTLHINYERDLLDQRRHQATFDRICDFIDIPRFTTQTTLVKQSENCFRESVSNYDELEQILNGTRYMKFLRQ